MDGVEDGTGVFERAAFAARGGTGADPTSVEQPGVGFVLGDFIGKHAGVAHGVECEEGLGETGGKRGLGLSDAVLGAGHLGSVTGDKVEHGLFGGEFGDGWEDAAGVTCEEDDVLGVGFSDAGDFGIINVFDWVGAATIY